MRHLFDRPLGAVIAPHGSLFKYSYDPSSLISAGLNFAGSVMNNQINAERAASDMATYLNLVHKQRDWQKEDQQWSEDYTKRLMDYQNSYNTPEAQMERFRKAGLNPYALMNNEGAIGSGQSQSIPSPNPSQHGSVTPFQRPQLDNPVSSAADKIFGASSVKSQRIGALAEFSRSLPDLVKSVGKDGAKRIAESFFGSQVDMNRIDAMIQNEVAMQSYDTKIREIEANIKTLYGAKEAANVIALQEQSFNKMQAEIGLMASQGKVNDKTIEKLTSDCVRNFADAFKLKKEGDMYVASAAQYKELSGLVHLQALRLKFQNKSQGFDEGSPLYDVFGQKSYVNNLGKAYELHADRAASQVEYFLNKWLGEYIKVSASGSVTPSVGGTYNFNNY